MAITVSEVLKGYAVYDIQHYGCPLCGYSCGAGQVQVDTVTNWTCENPECGNTCLVILSENGAGVYGNDLKGHPRPVEVCKHPREGTLSHTGPDRIPDGGGEYFDANEGWFDRETKIPPYTCFVCGNYQPEGALVLSVEVATVQAARRIVKMFSGYARSTTGPEDGGDLVEIAACTLHEDKLYDLKEMTTGGIITHEFINKAKT
jgi:hypothetical protein